MARPSAAAAMASARIDSTTGPVLLGFEVGTVAVLAAPVDLPVGPAGANVSTGAGWSGDPLLPGAAVSIHETELPSR